MVYSLAVYLSKNVIELAAQSSSNSNVDYDGSLSHTSKSCCVTTEAMAFKAAGVQHDSYGSSKG